MRVKKYFEETSEDVKKRKGGWMGVTLPLPLRILFGHKVISIQYLGSSLLSYLIKL